MKKKSKHNSQLSIRSQLWRAVKWLRDKLVFLLLLPFVIVIWTVIFLFRTIVGFYSWIVINVNKYYRPVLTFLGPISSFAGTNSERAVETLVQIEQLIGYKFNERLSRNIVDYLTTESLPTILFVVQSYTPFQIDEATKQKLVALLTDWVEEQSIFLKKEFPMHKIELEMAIEAIVSDIEKLIGHEFDQTHTKLIVDCLTTESMPTTLYTILSYENFQIDEATKQKLATLLKNWDDRKSILLEDD